MNQEVNLLKYLATVDSSIGKMYDKLIKELAKIGASINDLDTGKLFSFADYPQVKERVEKILDKYTSSLEERIINGMRDAIDMSYLANTSFLKDYSKLSNKALKAQRETAKEAFIRSRKKSRYGLGLSNRVWNYTNQAKAEFEAGMSEVIEEGFSDGISAEELGRLVRDKLKYPDMVYKRYHLKKLTKEGKKDVIEWRKRVIDEDGKVRFIKTELDMVGRGVYRSSRKNALRLAATEINMAYRYADNVRWQSEPFIRGIRIRLSNNHTLNGKPFHDICDELQGDYPKSFMWSGWHPRCRCSASPILVSQEEMDEISKLSEEEYQNYQPKDAITKMPDGFKTWFEENKERIIDSIKRGKQPYFIRDNDSWVNNLLDPKKRTEEQERVLIEFWNEKKKRTAFLRKRADNVMRVYNERFGFDMPGLSLFENAIENGDLIDIDTYTKKFAKNLSTTQRNVRKRALNQIALAKDVPEVDYSELEGLLKGNNIGLISEDRVELEQRTFDMINAEDALSDLIENVRSWHKTFTIKELQLAHDAIDKQFSKIDSLSTYDEKFKALEKEIKYVEDPNYLKKHTIYPTWKVVQDAYSKKYDILLDEKYWADVSTSYSSYIGFKTNSKVYASLLDKLNDAIQNKDNALADNYLNALSVQKAKLGKIKRKRNASKYSVNDDKLYDGGIPFTKDELDKISMLEDKILHQIFREGNLDSLLNEEYYDFLLSLTEKYYRKQKDLFSVDELDKMKVIADRYISSKSINPRTAFGAPIGGVYSKYDSKIDGYINSLIGLTEDELSIVKRFTNGSTFSNCVNLRHESPYWMKIFNNKMSMMTQHESSEVLSLIEDWSVGANYVLSKMQRYKGITFRGLSGGGATELSNKLTECFNKDIPWVNNASCSTSTKVSVSNSFDGDLLIVIHNKTGAYIHPISDYSHEFEVMTLKGAKYKVLKKPEYIKGRYICEIEEIID